MSDVKLGDVPHLYSLIPLAQSVAAPIIDLKNADGLVGAQYQQREEFSRIVGSIAMKLAKNFELGTKGNGLA
jgi:hypothetical protein